MLLCLEPCAPCWACHHHRTWCLTQQSAGPAGTVRRVYGAVKAAYDVNRMEQTSIQSWVRRLCTPGGHPVFTEAKMHSGLAQLLGQWMFVESMMAHIRVCSGRNPEAVCPVQPTCSVTTRRKRRSDPYAMRDAWVRSCEGRFKRRCSMSLAHVVTEAVLLNKDHT